VAAGAADNRRSCFSPTAWRGKQDRELHVEQTNTGSVHEPVQRGDNSTANAYLSQMLENGLPSVVDHRLGRYRQAPAAPGLVRNAGGGLVAEINISKIFVLKDEGHNSTNTGHGSFVAHL
jgi:hypothetical protein